MSKYKVDVAHLPTIKLETIGSDDFRIKLMNSWNWVDIDLDDAWYYYPSWEYWDKVFINVMAKLPKYVPEKFDCDNFAHYVSVLCARYFGINTCGVVEGYADVGNGIPQRHKWNVFFDGGDFYQLESQTYGMILDLDVDSKYIPTEIYLG